MPGTWASWGRDADGDGTASPFDPLDAIAAQGALMCHLLRTAQSTGWGDPIDLALAGYNAGWGAVTRYRGVPPYPETTAYIARIRDTAPSFAAAADTEVVATGGDVDAMLPSGYRNGRTAEAAVAWALSQVGAWRDAGYCLRFVARHAYQRPWDGGSIPEAHVAWDNTPTALRHPGSYDAPRGAVVLWDASIGGGAGHIAISLGDGRMVTTTTGAVSRPHNPHLRPPRLPRLDAALLHIPVTQRSGFGASMQDRPHTQGEPVTTQHHMATRWLAVWLTTVGIQGLQPAPQEPLLRWLLSLHERAIAEHEAALEGLGPHQEAIADQILHEVIATQKDTLPTRAQLAIQEGDLLAVRSAEIAAIVWTLAGLDAFSDPADNLLAWRERLRDAAASAAQLDQLPSMLAEARRG